MAKIIKGKNNSLAFYQNGTWYILGDHNILDQQDDNEFVYQIDEPFDKIKNEKRNTPIYAATSSFDDENPDNPITTSFETVEDLYNVVTQILDDLQTETEIDYSKFKQPMKLKNKLVLNNDQTIIDTLAKSIFEQVTWQKFSSYQSDFYEDIVDNPDYYEELFEPNNDINQLDDNTIKKLQKHNYTVIKNTNSTKIFTPAPDKEIGFQLQEDKSANYSETYYTLSTVNKMNETFILSACGAPFKFHNLAEITKFADTLD